MYKRTSLKWLKHWDFILLNMCMTQIAFALGYILRHGFINPYGNKLHTQVTLVVGLLDLFLGVFMESYSDILKRGYWIEFKNVLRHVILMTFGIVSYLFLTKAAEEY